MSSLQAYADFLTARWNEVEAVALSCVGKGADRFERIKSDCDWHIEVAGGMHVANLGRDSWPAVPELAVHISMQDPKSVLEDIKSKRAILAECVAYAPELEYGDNGEWAVGMVAHHLAEPFRSHPDHPENLPDTCKPV